jgi:hypothetical protein
VPGLVPELGMWGVPGMTPSTQRAVSWVYSLLLLLATWFVARRLARNDRGAAAQSSRIAEMQVWIALLLLASLRSPFVAQEYGPILAIVLLAVVAAASDPLSSARARNLALMTAGFIGLNILIPQDVPMNQALFTLLVEIPQAILTGLALFVIFRAARARCRHGLARPGLRGSPLRQGVDCRDAC